MGKEYHDYGMVLATPYGMPLGSTAIRHRFSKLIKEHDLPKVVFHSLRHTSVTYKLKLNGGDIKAVQGDSGHAQVNMVTEEKSVSVLTDEHGDFITDQDGIPLAIEETSEIAPGVLASIDRMMEILSKSLSESEKELYLPIVEYLKTHETIKNADGVKLTGKSAPTVNRYFARLIELDILIPEGENKGRIYRRKPA